MTIKAKRILKEAKNIESEFFELDQGQKRAKMELEFSSPNDIFDTNAKTKLPLLSDDFIDWVKTSFDYTPKGYKIDLLISFDDMGGYSEEGLQDIFKKNLLLESKRVGRDISSKNKIAVWLIVLGIIFLVTMILISALWKEENLVKTIFTYVADIAATVTIWEALTLLIVQNNERSGYLANLLKKYSSIRFVKKEK